MLPVKQSTSIRYTNQRPRARGISSDFARRGQAQMTRKRSIEELLGQAAGLRQTKAKKHMLLGLSGYMHGIEADASSRLLWGSGARGRRPCRRLGVQPCLRRATPRYATPHLHYSSRQARQRVWLGAGRS